MKSSVEHKMSTLLSREENEQVFRLFGSKCQSLATSIVQLYLTQSPDHARWIKKDTGVLCFIKDNAKRNYFFRLYCPNRSKLLWEQELYNNLDYKCPQDYFHLFEADDCMAGINFASDDEANSMKKVILEKVALKRQRREERRSRNSLQSRQSSGSTNQISNKQPFHSNATINSDKYPSSQPNSFPSYPSMAQSVRKKRGPITKDDIGLPCDFVHISHVGWDAIKGLDIDADDPNLLKFFYKAGVSDRQLRDKDTRNFIYDFINNHGGLDAVKHELTDTGAPKLPPLPKNGSRTHTPPPVPARTPVNRSAPPPPPPSKSRPPPIRGQPPPRPDTIPMVHTIPEPPPISNVPIPPPPPPMNNFVAPPPPMNNFVAPPPPMAMPPLALPPNINNNLNNQGDDPRSALLESIRAGRNLKPVEVEPKVAAAPDSRGNLLSEIRQGIELKPVTSNAQRPSSGPSCTENSLAEALSNALKARAFAIHSESESDSGNSTDDEDEWEQDE